MKTLDELRSDINRIDAELSKLIKERLTAARGVAEYKRANNLPIYHKAREEDVIAEFTKDFSSEEIPFSRAFIKTIIRQSREFQYFLNREERPESSDELSPACVYFQGISGSHSSNAAKKLYPDLPLFPCATFADVFKCVRESINAVGVLPIDNSTAGTVGDVYDLLTENNLNIVHAGTCAISHYLVGVPGTKLSDIKKVHSHPQALAQCASYLKAHNFEAVEATNTAIAAEHISKLGDKTVAAVASIETAKLYNLEILDSKINDECCNQTRFICIAKDSAATVAANRMSLAFDLPNEPGALSDILAIFSDSGVNLTKILSRPIPTKPWEYTFFLDCIYTPGSASLYGLLTHLHAEVPSTRILGIYSEEEVL